MKNLDQKVVLITGAAKGMGESHARAFVEAGSKVIITDIDIDGANKLAEELGENTLALQLDVSKADQWAQVVKQAQEAFGPINVLVNNAGVGVFKPIEDLTEDDLRLHFEINELGVFLGMQAVIPTMKENGGGSIVNISSVDGIIAAPTATAYAASKHAVEGMTKGAAIDLGSDNIRVNTVCPGIIKTDMASQEDVEAYLQELEQSIPLRRRGLVEETSDLVLFLASDSSTYITGTSHVIDGGMICQL